MTLAEIIAQIDTLKAEIDALRPIDAQQEARIRQKLRLDWNYHSNALEGNTLSLGETRAFLLHGITAKGKPFKDYLDIKGHNEAIAYLEEFVRGQHILTEAAIREIHKILLVESYEVDALTPDGQPTKRRITIGQYKTMPNHVRTSTGEMHYYAAPEETPAKMGDLMRWYREEREKSGLHPLILATTFHYEFVAIHPFDDGNGRLARLLTNLILMQAGYVPVIIKIATREEYLLALEKADAGELEDFIVLVGEELINSLELYLRGAKGESIEELEDLDKKIALLQKRLEGEEAIFIATSQSITLRVKFFNNLIRPLFQEIFVRFAKFEKFFNRQLCHLSYTVGSKQEKTKGKPTALLTLISEILNSDSIIKQISFSYDLIGFVKNKDHSISLNIEINLKQDQFVINYALNENSSIDKQELITDYYDSLYTKEKINELAFLIVSRVYKLIEDQIDT